MNGRRLPLAFFLVTAALCVAQAAHYYPLLPAKVASHFGSSGAPDGWMPKGPLIWTNISAVVMLALLLLGTASSMSQYPDSRIKLPHKDYWLAPQRREETFAVITDHFLWFGTATFLLLLDVFHQVFRFNLGQAPILEHPVQSLAAYVAFAIGWLISFWMRFARGVPSDPR
jgi:uncharacterized membrane protein